MPICKKCNNEFPNTVLIDNKTRHLKNRSYCLECSPFNTKGGYLLRKNSRKQRDIKKCKICLKEYQYNKNDVCSTCRSYYRRYKNKQKFVDYLGGQCYVCLMTDIDCLTFHHIDPNNKTFDLSDGWLRNVQYRQTNNNVVQHTHIAI